MTYNARKDVYKKRTGLMGHSARRGEVLLQGTGEYCRMIY